VDEPGSARYPLNSSDFPSIALQVQSRQYGQTVPKSRPTIQTYKHLGIR
jgi:hypothetical protein